MKTKSLSVPCPSFCSHKFPSIVVAQCCDEMEVKCRMMIHKIAVEDKEEED